MIHSLSRTEILFGKDALEKLGWAKVAIFGVGGVGCAVAEGLVRSGIGNIDLIDNDVYTLTNLNRQLYATHQTLGKYKVDVAQARLMDINPSCVVRTHKTFFLPENKNDFNFKQYDYVVDAIDTVAGKIALIEAALNDDVPIICSMGAGNKIDPTAFEVADIYETSVCPLAQVMRKELKKRGIEHLKVVYSKEKALKPIEQSEEKNSKRTTTGSTSFVPPVVGFILAGEVIKDIINIKRK